MLLSNQDFKKKKKILKIENRLVKYYCGFFVGWASTVVEN
jgi:hypothetical protein